MKIVIIEDEVSCREYLKNTLARNFSQLEIVAEPDSVPGGIAAIREHRPDILYLDVEIKQGTCFDVLAQVPATDMAIIFTTAFDTFAVDAFRHHAVDYLLKPLQRSQLIDATARAVEKAGADQHRDRLLDLLQTVQQPAVRKSKLSVHTLEGIEFIEITDIVHAEARGNYTVLFLEAGVSVVASRPIREFEAALHPHRFFRIHHSYLVSLRYLKKYHKGRGGDVTLQNGVILPVAANKRDAFLAWLEE